MAKRSTPNDRIRIDPLFPIPEGAEEQFAYTREGTDTDETVDDGNLAFDYVSDVSETEFEIEYDDGSSDDDAIDLASPALVTILSQTLRRAPGGQQVVDIVVEAEDVAEAIKYEVQVAKV